MSNTSTYRKLGDQFANLGGETWDKVKYDMHYDPRLVYMVSIVCAIFSISASGMYINDVPKEEGEVNHSHNFNWVNAIGASIFILFLIYTINTDNRLLGGEVI